MGGKGRDKRSSRKKSKQTADAKWAEDESANHTVGLSRQGSLKKAQSFAKSGLKNIRTRLSNPHLIRKTKRDPKKPGAAQRDELDKVRQMRRTVSDVVGDHEDQDMDIVDKQLAKKKASAVSMEDEVDMRARRSSAQAKGTRRLSALRVHSFKVKKFNRGDHIMPAV